MHRRRSRQTERQAQRHGHMEVWTYKAAHTESQRNKETDTTRMDKLSRHGGPVRHLSKELLGFENLLSFARQKSRFSKGLDKSEEPINRELTSALASFMQQVDTWVDGQWATLPTTEETITDAPVDTKHAHKRRGNVAYHAPPPRRQKNGGNASRPRLIAPLPTQPPQAAASYTDTALTHIKFLRTP